jgi:MinD superfamily P-loop ATPase
MELAVLSGKGGTGKTTIVAALSELQQSIVKVDCDVDAPNLYLFYEGENLQKQDFFGGKKAVIDENTCIHCGACDAVCKFKAIKNACVDLFLCEGCGTCRIICPVNAIQLVNEKTADTYITETTQGILSRASMGIGADGSGKLITKLRKNVKAYEANTKLTILDGSPGIGCSVIASITGVDIVLLVTEPTMSGLNDLKRIVELSRNFDAKVLICINKYDINQDMTTQIEEYATENGLEVVGKIPFDPMVMVAINHLKPITAYPESIAKIAIEEMWNILKLNFL